MSKSCYINKKKKIYSSDESESNEDSDTSDEEFIINENESETSEELEYSENESIDKKKYKKNKKKNHTSNNDDNIDNNIYNISSYQKDEYEDEYDDEDDDEDDIEEDDNNNMKQNIILILKNNKRKINDVDNNNNNNNNKKKINKYSNILKKYNSEEKNYFNNLSETNKELILSKENELEYVYENIPNRFKFLEYDIPITVKKMILSHIEQLNNMSPSSSEYFKLTNWINILSRIPISKYNKLTIKDNDDVALYLKNIKSNIDNNIFGHTETKEQIIRILAQWISNPNKTGYVIGINGPPGVGKTKLVKECICKAMNFPLAFISLGGIDDSSYLTGFNYTYEGSKYGKILDCLIKAEVMNPVFLFDELDKVSATSRGDEIINTLIHLTDPIQNEKFTDKYFQEIDLDLSKSIIIFTYNNEDYINPILKDRMITINVNGYDAKEKLIITKKYLIDELLPKYNMKKGDIIFDDKLIEYIISSCSMNEGGVRNLKRNINNIISWINMMRYVNIDDIEIKLPYKVSIDFYNKYCKKNDLKVNKNTNSMYL